MFFSVFLCLVAFLGFQNNKLNAEQELAHEHIGSQWDEMEASSLIVPLIMGPKPEIV